MCYPIHLCNVRILAKCVIQGRHLYNISIILAKCVIQIQYCRYVRQTNAIRRASSSWHGGALWWHTSLSIARCSATGRGQGQEFLSSLSVHVDMTHGAALADHDVGTGDEVSGTTN